MDVPREVNEKSAYDARFSDVLGGEEYDDLLIALEFYNKFQSGTGQALREYIGKYGKDLPVVRVLEAGRARG